MKDSVRGLAVGPAGVCLPCCGCHFTSNRRSLLGVPVLPGSSATPLSLSGWKAAGRYVPAAAQGQRCPQDGNGASCPRSVAGVLGSSICRVTSTPVSLVSLWDGSVAVL